LVVGEKNMVIEIQQITRRGELKYKAISNGKTFCDIYSPWEERKKECYFTFEDASYYMIFGDKNESVFKNPKGRLTMQLFCNNERIGGIVNDEACISSERKHGERGLHHIEYKGENYDVYVTTVINKDESHGILGSEKYRYSSGDDYFCVLNNLNQRVAEIRRNATPRNEYDYYVIFTEDEKLSHMLCLFAIYMDMMVFYNTGEFDDELYGIYAHKEGDKYHSFDYVKNIADMAGYDMKKRQDWDIIKNGDVEIPEVAKLKTKISETRHWIIYAVFLIIFLILFIPNFIKMLANFWQLIH
jgi:hypothetical protein